MEKAGTKAGTKQGLKQGPRRGSLSTHQRPHLHTLRVVFCDRPTKGQGDGHSHTPRKTWAKHNSKSRAIIILCDIIIS